MDDELEKLNKQKNDQISNEMKLSKAFKRLFDSDDGKVVLNHLMMKYNSFHPISGDHNDPYNPNKILILEGARRVVLDILYYVKRDDEEIQSFINSRYDQIIENERKFYE